MTDRDDCGVAINYIAVVCDPDDVAKANNTRRALLALMAKRVRDQHNEYVLEEFRTLPTRTMERAIQRADKLLHKRLGIATRVAQRRIWSEMHGLTAIGAPSVYQASNDMIADAGVDADQFDNRRRDALKRLYKPTKPVLHLALAMWQHADIRMMMPPNSVCLVDNPGWVKPAMSDSEQILRQLISAKVLKSTDSVSVLSRPFTTPK